MSKSHRERVEDPDTEVRWLGYLEGMAIGETPADPEDPGQDDLEAILFLHGNERSSAVQITDPQFVDKLTEVAAEMALILDG